MGLESHCDHLWREDGEKTVLSWGCLGYGIHPQCIPRQLPWPLLQISGFVSSGPTHWKELAPDCGGPAQSPINIDLHLVQRDYTLEPFIFQGYDSAPLDPWTLENDGHTGQHHKVRTKYTEPRNSQLSGILPIHRDQDTQRS